MNKITIAVLICLVLASTVLAQDWRDVDNNGTGFDCDLVDTLVEEYGEENILRADVDDFTSLAEFLDMLFPACSSQNMDPVAARGCIRRRAQSHLRAL